MVGELYSFSDDCKWIEIVIGTVDAIGAIRSSRLSMLLHV